MIKTLVRSVREYKKSSILTMVTVSLEVILEVIIPILMANLIDYGIDRRNMKHILMIGVLLLVAASFSLLFGALAGKYAAVASAGFAKNLRKDMYDNVQNFSFSNIDKFSTASIVTRLTTDVTNLQQAYQMIIRMAIRCPFMLTFALVVSISIDAKLSLIFLGCIPFLAIGLYLIIRIAHPIFVKVFKLYDKLNGVVQENLYGIRVVKSYNRQEFEEDKFKSFSTKIYDLFVKAEKTLAFNMPLMQFTIYTCLILISWFGARAVVASGGNPKQGLSTGELMSFFTYTMQILMSLMMLSMVFVMVIISKASAERIVEILNEESDLTNCEEPVKSVKNGSITFQNVSFEYAENSEKPVLSHINISIKSGETIGIIGGTGSSKSSLVQLIPRLYDVSEGAVLVGDVDVRKYDIETLRMEVAMVLQKNLLFSGTIKENLRWGNENATEEQLVNACKMAQADEFINNFPDGYDTYIEQGGTNVSGGQKQRLCIARALLKKPKVLILDDSTSAVDTKTDALIRDAFLKEIPDTTKIIIAQRISSIQDADRIIVLDDGKVMNYGTHEELLAESSIYQEVYESQMKGAKEDE